MIFLLHSALVCYNTVNGGVNVSHLAEQQCTTQWVYSRDRPGCQFQF